MARLLFIVADRFLVRGRGVVLLPGIVPIDDERFHTGDPLLLKRPDGSQLEATIGGLEMFTQATQPEVPVMLKGLSKDDVPIDTEVWSVDRPAGRDAASNVEIK